MLELPGGVTLASDRGIDDAPGGLIRSDSFTTRPLIRTTGAAARLTGIRLQGPNPRRCLEHHSRAFREGHGGHDYYYRFPTSIGIDAAHLLVHRELGQGVEVVYTERNDRLIALEVNDRPSESPKPTSVATTGPTRS